MIVRLIKFKLEGWETRETTRENVLQPPFLRCQQMGVILQLLLIKAIVYGVGIQQRHTQCVCFNSERSPLGMGKDMRNGRGLCLPLMINKGTLASAANEAVCTTWKVLRGRGRDDAAPRLCHTACPWHLYCVPAVHPASSSVWRVTTLILLILCMGMVVGLVALGIMCKYWLLAKVLIWEGTT